MRYLLDTCAVSDFSKGIPGVFDRVKSSALSDLSASAITLMEVEYGLRLPSRVALSLKPIMDTFFGSIQVIAFDARAAQFAADVRANLKNRGRPIGAYDVLIAATALAHDLTLITSNVRELSQVEMLRIENWRA